MAQVAPNSFDRMRIARSTCIRDESSQMLALAYHLEAEALGRRRRRMRRRADDVGAAVGVEQFGDRNDAARVLFARLETREQVGEGIALRGWSIGGTSLAQRRRGVAQQGGGGAQKGDAIRIERSLSELEWLRDQLGARHHLGQWDDILDPRDAAEGANATQHVHGGVPIVRPRGEELETRGDVRRFGGEESAARRCLCRRRGARRRGGGDPSELSDPRGGALVITSRPGANGANENLQIVDRRHQRPGQRRGPLYAPLAQCPPDALEGAGQLGEGDQLGHRRAAAQSAGVAGYGFGIGSSSSRARARQNAVELLDVFARLENEEIEESG